MREFAFELRLCAHLETTTDEVVSRQLGGGVAAPGNRVLDVVCVEPGPAFEERTAVTPAAVPVVAIESDAGPGRFRPVTDAFDCAPEQARRIAERAVEAGFFERERRDGRDCVRQVTRYPDWFGRLQAVENKPDLGSPGALRRQLRTDVSLGVVDEAVLVTASHVTRAHLNRIPEAVGVWRFRPDADPDDRIEVVREPRPLATEEGGVELLAERPGRSEVAVVTAAEKARARRRIAERAYGKGWRTYDLPACSNASAGACGDARGLPDCEYAGRLVDEANDCGPSCPGYDPADPPAVDLAAERDRLTPWVRDPEGAANEQAGLDRF